MKRLKNLMDYVPLISNDTKLFISGSLFVIALIMCDIRKTEDAFLCAIAMGFSSLGDLSLNWFPLDKRPRWLMYVGAGFFMVAHVFYALAYGRMIYLAGTKFLNPLALIAIGFMMAFLLVSAVCVTHSKHKDSLGLVMILIFGFYIFVIGGNFVTIWSYAGNYLWTLKALCAVGALSFLMSDFIIGVETVFKVKSEILRKLVWILYPISQIFIIVFH